MTLRAIGEQHGISRERVRQIVKQMPRAAAEAAMVRARASLEIWKAAR
jgi:DNA-directed RNA polymerase sigma subunit (sigma70/sigma32)